MQLKYLNAIKDKLSKIRVVTQSKSNPMDDGDDALLRCIYFGKSTENEGNEEKKYSSNSKSLKPVSNLNDDVQRIKEYSLMTTGARYELLNANRLLMDIDVGMQVRLLSRNKHMARMRSLNYMIRRHICHHLRIQ
jgi:hypothetical protein